jgi:DNA-binding LytR/AlgR family response regulator
MTPACLSVLAVDDELPQLEDLARMLRGNPRVAEVKTAASGDEAVAIASRRGFDAIFLDVRMPRLNGLDLGRKLRCCAHSASLVFVSGFDASAAAVSELRAVDFLTKPVSTQRLDEALRRVSALATGAPRLRPGRDQDDTGDVIAVEHVSEGTTRLLETGSILYAKSYGDYVRLFTATDRYLLRATLNHVEERLASQGFLRVHRQYLAHLTRAAEVRRAINGTALLVYENGGRVPVARRHAAEIRRQLRP